MLKHTLTAACVAGMINYSGCSEAIDPNKPQAIYVNGQASAQNLTVAQLYQHRDTKPGEPQLWSIVWRHPENEQTHGAVGIGSGLYLTFQPDSFAGSTTVRPGQLTPNMVIRFYPRLMAPNAILFHYTTEYDVTDSEVKFTEFDPTPGGRIKGTIIKGELRSYIEDLVAQTVKPSSEQKIMQLYNFEFDVSVSAN